AILDKSITERHARAIIRAKDEKRQLETLQKLIAKGLNVKETESIMEKLNDKQKTKKKRQPKQKGVRKDIRTAMNTIAQPNSKVADTGIHVESDEEEKEDYYQITIRIPKQK